MRDAVAVAHVGGVFDVVAVVEDVGDAVLGVHAAHEDSGADVAEFAVGGACRAPEFAGVGEGVGGRVELDEFGELGGGDGGELGFDPVFGVLGGFDVSGDEDGAFVGVVAGKYLRLVFCRAIADGE